MDKEQEKLLIGGAVVVGLFVAGKSILQGLGFIKSNEEKARDAANDAAMDSGYQAAIANQNPTKTAAEWSSIAGAIYEDLKYTALSDNKSDAGYQLARVQNDADVYTLIKLFGKRQEYTFGLPLGDQKSLFTFVSTNLSPTTIAAINDNYRRKNIKFRW